MDNLESLLVFLFIGLIAGWLAGVLFKGSGFGILGDIVVGVIGAEIGGWIFDKVGLSAYGFGGAVLMAFVGAIALLVVIKLIRNVGSAKAMPVVLFLLSCSLPVHAATTVTVDDNSHVQVSQNQPQTIVVQQVPAAVVAVVDTSADFEGEIEKIDRSARVIDIIDTDGRTRQVMVTQEIVDTYRAGDFVRIHPVTGVREVVFVREESNRDLEGRIINVDNSQGTIVVHDTHGHDRRVQIKKGMISNYKVDDYVRIHLMADLKEAKMIRTIK